MATQTGKLPNAPAQGGMTDILALMQSLNGSKTKTKSSQTQQTNLSSEAMNELIQQMLEDNSGLANVSSGQRAAGLYNSSTNTQLTNDLISRVSGKAALASAPTTTTTSNTQQAPGLLGDVNPLLALAAPTLLKAGGDVLSKILTPPPVLTKNAITGAAGTADFLSEGGNFLSEGGNFLGSAIPATGSVAELGDVFSNSSLANTGFELFSTGADALNLGNDLFSGVDSSGSLGGLGGFGGALGTASSIYDIFSAEDPMEAITKNLLTGGSSAVLSTIPVIGPFLALATGLFGSSSVICTHMHQSGLLSDELNAAEHLHGASVHPATYAGYRLWADPTVAWLKKSPRATRFFAPFVRAYVQQNANILGISPKGSLLGAVIKAVGEPTCYILGQLFCKKVGGSYGF